MSNNLPPLPDPGTGPRAATAPIPASTLGACPSIDSVVNRLSLAADPAPTLPPPVHVVRHDSGGTSSAAAVPRHPTLPSPGGPDRSFPASPMRAGTLPPRPVPPLRADSSGGKPAVASAIPRAMTTATGTAPRAMPRTGHDAASRDRVPSGGVANVSGQLPSSSLSSSAFAASTGSAVPAHDSSAAAAPAHVPDGTIPRPAPDLSALLCNMTLHRSVTRTGTGARSVGTMQSTPSHAPPPEDPAQVEADAAIHRGIQLHERMQLLESTAQFQRAAELGSPLGAFLYGMALRSGWGVPVDEPTSFTHLSRAADLAMRHAVNSASPMALAARELTMAIYELGQSFRHGWGTPKSQRTALFYFQIAANLGDPDAQIDLATYHLAGDGVRRDKVLAARYFRMAANQGVELPSNAWIWKDKYDGCGISKGGEWRAPGTGVSTIDRPVAVASTSASGRTSRQSSVTSRSSLMGGKSKSRSSVTGTREGE
ncbi:hypothetical protein AMAG_10945 [Allomyces macrogynus ATCC 38327]|uniref:HCP-like protein n=1 Tax=Allomyces macrogynus (strain ATCC 38327) TaxID=578462 RepID=A0A0L0SS07_ALLM3|nr:hypothetical protein AMAG_10945 [Allomyces macrogynus ATCC 38327]|eukprot:KNE65302.1 hypothetical protein AMAG_10945 [Allomyces macrogynus ATCC 38327]